MTLKKDLLNTLKILITAIILSLSISVVYAQWVAPTQAPPGGNVSTPINTGDTAQLKGSGLTTNANNISANGLLVPFGNVGIGTANPQAKLDVLGTIKIADTLNGCTATNSGEIKYDGVNFFGCTNGVWEGFTSVQGAYTFTISSDISNFNMASTFGLSQPRDIILIIDSGVTVSSTNVGTPALDTGSFPAGSTLTINNNGTIVGAGGAGGGGGVANGISGSATSGASGGIGGNAINISLDVTINNTGNIYAGGGGGGGGGAEFVGCIASSCYGGGGGGGGAGNIGGSGASGGAASGCSGSNISGGFGNTGGGSGGSGGSSTSGIGGTGGGYGMVGSDGGSTSISSCGGSVGIGGIGAAPGKAVNLNGFIATISGGGSVLGVIN